MKIQIESTTKMVQLNGVPARIWEGATESGISVHVFVTRIAPAIGIDDPRQDKFAAALQETRAPSVEVASYPMRMIL